MADSVYLSSSWKNRDRVRALATRIREHRISVYDFTDPACRKTKELPPEAFPEEFDPARDDYATYLNAHPEWRAGVDENRRAIEACEVLLLLLPCGAEAHADWGLAVGLGKKTIVVGSPRQGERSPTHLWADAILQTDDAAVDWVRVLVSETIWAGEAPTRILDACEELHAAHTGASEPISRARGDELRAFLRRKLNEWEPSPIGRTTSYDDAVLALVRATLAEPWRSP